VLHHAGAIGVELRRVPVLYFSASTLHSCNAFSRAALMCGCCSLRCAKLGDASVASANPKARAETAAVGFSLTAIMASLPFWRSAFVIEGMF
jgi:hypothetical protein